MTRSEVTSRRFVSHAVAARMRGVSTKTLDRWAAAGIIDKPETINGRKYHEIENVEVIKGASRKAAPAKTELQDA